MTRAQSVDVLNAGTTIQSRIDTVLAAPVMGWDMSPEIDWQPGDPLYDRPVYAQGGQYVRPMIEEIDEELSHYRITVHDEDEYESYYYSTWTPRCWTCEVSWSGPEACWSCGEPPKPRRPTQGFDTVTVTLDEVGSFDEWPRRWVEAMQPINAQIDRMVELMRVANAEPGPGLRIPAGAEITPVNSLADLVEMGQISNPGDHRPRGYSGNFSEARRRYFDRPVTETRRPREHP